MVLNMKANLLIMIQKDREHINGQIIEYIQDYGRKTICMDMDSCVGQMEENIQQ